MKVRVTTELTDADRLMIGAALNGKMGTPATHEECTRYLEYIIGRGLSPLRRKWEIETKEIIEAIRAKLDTDES